MRLRWWKYHHGGRGLEPRAAALPLLEGGVGHSAIEAILRGAPPEDVLARELPPFAQELRARGCQTETVDELFLLEQQTLLAGLIWAWTEIRLPVLVADYDVVLIEREIQWEMAEGTEQEAPLVDMVRADTLLRRRADARLFYREWKFVSTGGEDWAKGWEHTSQALANCMALESTLKERIWGMQVEGLIKGRRQREQLKTSRFYGQRIQQSPLCYGWKNGKTYQVATPRGGGWTRVRSWEEMPIREWVAKVMTREEKEALFAEVPPVVPRRERMESWRRQEVAKERRLAAWAAELGPFPSAEALDVRFPQNEDHCLRYWGYPCAFEAACFTGQVGRDPVGSGLYQWRVPHHESERGAYGLGGDPTAVATGAGSGSKPGPVGDSRED